MNDIEIYYDIKELFNTYKIGNITKKPISISGGLLHKMYKVITDTNEYAVKLLNPSIMQRNGVMENMINSERIAYTFSIHLPVIAALNFNGETVLTSNNKYYMVFYWLDGAPLFPPFIEEKHCFEIGNYLGKMHSLNITVPGLKKHNDVSVIYNWQQFLEKGKEQKAYWVEAYANMIGELNIWNNRINNASIKLSEYMVISHRDLDPKNVIWKQDKPYIIDWEAAGYVNPYQELLEVLNYWVNKGNGELDKVKFKTLLNAYRINMNTDTVNWDCVLDSGYTGMLGWLEYSLKRALGIESMDDDERLLGAEQISETIKELQRYDIQVNKMKEWLR